MVVSSSRGYKTRARSCVRLSSDSEKMSASAPRSTGHAGVASRMSMLA